tara:strand:- start:279 stop:449 length:171 start_codon:yes stop_codon:yes gene_type:complete
MAMTTLLRMTELMISARKINVSVLVFFRGARFRVGLAIETRVHSMYRISSKKKDKD